MRRSKNYQKEIPWSEGDRKYIKWRKEYEWGSALEEGISLFQLSKDRNEAFKYPQTRSQSQKNRPICSFIMRYTPSSRFSIVIH